MDRSLHCPVSAQVMARLLTKRLGGAERIYDLGFH
jgi:hypothetical protein